MPAIDPDIACSSCITAANNGSRAADFQCVDCCIRNIEDLIDFMGGFGGDGHAEQIRDKLAEKWIREA